MDPPSPIRRDLAQEEILEDTINHNVDPAESPSSYLNPSGDGLEHDVDDRREDEAERSDDGEAGGQTKSGEVYISSSAISRMHAKNKLYMYKLKNICFFS